jgi:hypothetical protein
MSIAALTVIDAIISLLETETKDIKAGRLSQVAETAERKARLMHQLSRVEPVEPSAETSGKLLSLQNALRSNLRVCKDNIESIKEIIDLHLAIERDVENDGTYTMPVRLQRPA